MGRHFLDIDQKSFCGKDIEWLKHQYFVKKKSMNEIARKIGCTRQYVSLFLKSCNCQARGGGTAPIFSVEDFLPLFKKGLSNEVIEKKMGCSYATVLKFRKETGIRSYRNNNLDPLRDKEWLRKKYIDEGLSQKKISELLGITSYITVAFYLKKHGIPTKKKGSYKNSPNDKKIKYPQLRDLAWLIDMINEGLGIADIARKLRSSYTIVYNAIKEHNLLRKVKGWTPRNK